MRCSGRCCASWTIPVAASKSSAPAAQPYRTIAATAKTNVSERTPPPSGLIGTGNRSASAAAAVSAAIPARSRPLCDDVANSYAAATRTPRPATQTGTMRAASFRGVPAEELMPRPLPGQLVERVPRQLSDRGRNEHEDEQETDQPRLPLQHQRTSRARGVTSDCAILTRRTLRRIPRRGDLVESTT